MKKVLGIILLSILVSCVSNNNYVKQKCKRSYKTDYLNRINCGMFYLKYVDFENTNSLDSLLLTLKKMYQSSSNFSSIHFQHDTFMLNDNQLDSVIHGKDGDQTFITYTYKSTTYMGKCFINESNLTLSLFDFHKFGVTEQDTLKYTTLEPVKNKLNQDTLLFKIKCISKNKGDMKFLLIK